MTEVAGKPTIPQVHPDVVRLYHETRTMGCCLHILLDDGNVSTGDVQWCLDEAISQGHPFCEQLARTLLQMSRTQRAKLSAMNDNRYDWI